MSVLQNKKNFLVGVISDTHGLLRPQVAKVFKNADLIVHAGDIDRPGILEALQKIAPVKAVRGNMDYGEWANEIPATEVIEIGDVLLYMLHDLCRLDLEPAASGFSAVINGHTHQPLIEKENGVLFLNPGSAGPPRRNYPISVALLHVRGTDLDAQIVQLDV
ncbi:MAG: YfcE family phosphodiesterase [Deltaproteobacteria bacterium]|nr:MAG: YfcE family phosphodiesterase [Deltaproteobacteria bacterium]